MIKEQLPDFAELAYEPGSEGVYTNVGYMLLAAVIEAASGQTYQQYMIDHIFKPLGMDQTNWTYTEAMIANEATGSSPSVDIQALLLPLVIEKDKKVRVIRFLQEPGLFDEIIRDIELATLLSAEDLPEADLHGFNLGTFDLSDTVTKCLVF